MICADISLLDAVSGLAEAPDSECLDAGVVLWSMCLNRAEAGTGWLPFSVLDAARQGGIAFELVEPALERLGLLGVLAPCPPLPGCVPFKLNLAHAPIWALDAAISRHQYRLRSALRARWLPFSR